MERQPKSVKDVVQLLQLTDLISITGRKIIDEWSKESENPKVAALQDDGSSISAILPSRELHEMQRIVLAAAGSLIELVEEPSRRLLEVSSQYFEARALHVAAERRIPDLLSSASARNGDQSAGLSVKEIGNATGIEPLKLCELSLLIINFSLSSTLYTLFLARSVLLFGGAKHLSMGPRDSSASAMSLLYAHLQRSRARSI